MRRVERIQNQLGKHQRAVTKTKSREKITSALYNTLLDRVRIDVDNLSQEFVEQSGFYVWVAMHLREVKHRAGLDKVMLETLIAKKEIEMRVKSTETGGRLTDSTVKAAVAQLEEVVSQKRIRAAAEADLVFWETIKDIMQQRGYLLSGLAQLTEGERMQPSAAFNKESISRLREIRGKRDHAEELD